MCFNLMLHSWSKPTENTDPDLFPLLGLFTESEYRPMMNVDNDDTELGLALGYSSVPSVRTRSNNNSGAGVNAGSSLNIAFVASNPLAELVWSPSKGLSLKCGDKKSAFLWDVGPSNPVRSPADNSAGSGGNNEEKPIAEGRSIPLQEDINVENEVAKDAGLELALSPRNFGGLFGCSHECNTRNFQWLYRYSSFLPFRFLSLSFCFPFLFRL